MSSACGMQPFRPGRWRGETVVDLAWSAALVAAASLAAGALQRIGAAPAFAACLAAAGLLGARRAVTSGAAALLSVVALLALCPAVRPAGAEPAPSALSILATGAFALALTTGFAAGRLRDQARRRAARRRALLDLARSYATVIRPSDPAEPGRSLVRWAQAVMGTDACYIEARGPGGEIVAGSAHWWPPGVSARMLAARARAGRTQSCAALRARPLGDPAEAIGVLAWRSPAIPAEGSRRFDQLMADVVDAIARCRGGWPDAPA